MSTSDRSYARWDAMLLRVSLSVLACLGPSALAADPPGLAGSLVPLAKAHKGKVGIAVKHLGTGEAFTLNADEPMPTASLIKFPVMAEAYFQYREGRVRPSDLVTLGKEDMVPGSGILTSHFSPGATFTLRDAVRLMIVYSDNTATNLVLDHIGIPTTNARMESLGLTNTRIHSKVFKRSTTTIDPKRSEKFGLGSTTANEQIRLLALLNDGKLVDRDACSEMLETMKKCEDADKFPRFLPRGTVVAMKTGSVSDARACAGIIYVSAHKTTSASNPSGPPNASSGLSQAVAVCVLTAENADKSWVPDNAGNILCAKVAKAVFDHFSSR